MSGRVWDEWQSEVALSSSGTVLPQVPDCVLTLSPTVVLAALTCPCALKQASLVQRAVGVLGPGLGPHPPMPWGGHES